jgi:hypothetical protein
MSWLRAGSANAPNKIPARQIVCRDGSKPRILFAEDSDAARTLTAMRFLNPRLPRRLMPRLRRLFARAGLEKEEVNILRGILARIDDVLRR